MTHIRVRAETKFRVRQTPDGCAPDGVIHLCHPHKHQQRTRRRRMTGFRSRKTEKTRLSTDAARQEMEGSLNSKPMIFPQVVIQTDCGASRRSHKHL
jgi:hypothetical protein